MNCSLKVPAQCTSLLQTTDAVKADSIAVKYLLDLYACIVNAHWQSHTHPLLLSPPPPSFLYTTTLFPFRPDLIPPPYLYLTQPPTSHSPIPSPCPQPHPPGPPPCQSPPPPPCPLPPHPKPQQGHDDLLCWPACSCTTYILNEHADFDLTGGGDAHYRGVWARHERHEPPPLASKPHSRSLPLLHGHHKRQTTLHDFCLHKANKKKEQKRVMLLCVKGASGLYLPTSLDGCHQSMLNQPRSTFEGFSSVRARAICTYVMQLLFIHLLQ